MTHTDGTPLYLQVEEALKEFQTGVARLKNQQTQTETLLQDGNQALEKLVFQVTRIDQLQEQVESDLRLVERLRENTGAELAELRHQVLTDLSQHQKQTCTDLENLKTDFSIRRQELLGLVRDLRKNLQALEQNTFNLREETCSLLSQQQNSLTIAEETNRKLHTCAAQQERLTWLTERLDRQKKYLWATVVVLALMQIATLIFA